MRSQWHTAHDEKKTVSDGTLRLLSRGVETGRAVSLTTRNKLLLKKALLKEQERYLLGTRNFVNRFGAVVGCVNSIGGIINDDGSVLSSEGHKLLQLLPRS